MKISINQIKTIIILIILIILLLPITFWIKFDGLEIFLFLTIGIFSMLEIVHELKIRTYSLNLIHWLFVFFFYFLAPIQQISNDYQPWGLDINTTEIYKTCIIILIWIIVYKTAYSFTSKKTQKNNNYMSSVKKDVNISNKALVVITIINILSCLFLIKTIGFNNLFARKTNVLQIEQISGSLKLIIIHTLRSVVPFSLAISLMHYIRNKKGIIYLIINIIVLLIVCFPTGLGRSEAANMYLGLLVILFYKKIDKNKNNVKYIFVFVAAFILIFPTINVFRNVAFNKVDIITELTSTIEEIRSTYVAGDYDAYTMINQTIIFVKENDITYGKQLIGAMLFFIPRKIWLNKPLGSGYTILDTLGHSFKNVSCPLIAEGYINFGVFGVIIFSMFFSICSCKLDLNYWKMIENGKEKVNYNLLSIIYPFLIPSYYILQRGDLMSITSLTMALIISFVIMYKISVLCSFNKGNRRKIADEDSTNKQCAKWFYRKHYDEHS